MQRVSLHLRGPVRRPLWNRLRRRLVQSSSAGVITTTLAGGALYVASAVEPNLSGVWVRDGRTELRLFHVGSRVTASYENGVTSFDATFSSSSKLKGYINLQWLEEDMRHACGHGLMKDHTFEATINGNYDVIREHWTQTWADQATCLPTSARLQSSTLRRKTK